MLFNIAKEDMIRTSAEDFFPVYLVTPQIIKIANILKYFYTVHSSLISFFPS